MKIDEVEEDVKRDRKKGAKQKRVKVSTNGVFRTRQDYRSLHCVNYYCVYLLHILFLPILFPFQLKFLSILMKRLMK